MRTIRGSALLLMFLMIAASASSATFPCTVAGINDAIAMAPGPHELSCLPGQTLTISSAFLINVDLTLDLGGLTIDCTSPGCPDAFRMTVVPACGLACPSIELSDFRLVELGLEIVGPYATLRNATISGGPGIDLGGTVPPFPFTEQAGRLHLIDSTIEDASVGVEMRFGSSATIERSLITRSVNHGLWLTLTTDNTAVLLNSTLSDNGTAVFGGAGVLNAGMVTMENSTITAQGANQVAYSDLLVFQVGGSLVTCFSTGHASSVNTLVDGGCSVGISPPTTCVDPPPPGTMTSLGGNLESDADTCGFDDPSDQVDVSTLDLALDSLADNLGPTETHALLPGSVAIDAALLSDCPSEDQRGFARPEIGGNDCDTGAFELPEPGSAVMLSTGILLVLSLARRRGPGTPA